MMVTSRMQKFDELILREVSEQLRELFPDKIISVTQVHVSKDLSFAKVWLSSYQNISEIVVKAQQNAGSIRKELSKKIIARRVPSLYFVSDLTEEKAEKIDKLLNELRKEQK